MPDSLHGVLDGSSLLLRLPAGAERYLAGLAVLLSSRPNYERTNRSLKRFSSEYRFKKIKLFIVFEAKQTPLADWGGMALQPYYLGPRSLRDRLEGTQVLCGTRHPQLSALQPISPKPLKLM